MSLLKKASLEAGTNAEIAFFRHRRPWSASGGQSPEDAAWTGPLPTPVSQGRPQFLGLTRGWGWFHADRPCGRPGSLGRPAFPETQSVAPTFHHRWVGNAKCSVAVLSVRGCRVPDFSRRACTRQERPQLPRQATLLPDSQRSLWGQHRTRPHSLSPGARGPRGVRCGKQWWVAEHDTFAQ